MLIGSSSLTGNKAEAIEESSLDDLKAVLSGLLVLNANWFLVFSRGEGANDKESLEDQ
jgi:hypothetical protein